MKGGGGSTAAKAGGGGSGTLLIRILKAPLRALRRARDLYVTGMTRCAGHVGYAGMAGYPGGAGVGAVPRSYSFHTTSRSSGGGEDDLRELIRAASQGPMGSLNLGGGLGRSPAPGGHGKGGGGAVPRSQSVGMGRIDEDRPCEFGEDFAMAGPLYPRSKSCAVSKRKVGVVNY